MLNKLSILLLFCLISCTLSMDNFYTKIIQTTDPQAKCLDGSPSMYYIREGIEKDKFLLFFIGGGYCGGTTLASTLQSCYSRSKTELGSSNVWPDKFIGTEGYISLTQPTYKNWTKVVFIYCDGSFHQGGNDNPIPYKDRNLYFRGNRIVKANFKHLIDNYQMNKASKIMLTGGSAGAIAAFTWSNYLQSIVNNPNVVYTVPDSGIFLSVNTFKQNINIGQIAIKNLATLMFANQKSPLDQCNRDYPGEQYKCISIQANYKYLKGKYLYINSQYDQYTISMGMQIKCLKKGTSGYTLKYCSPAEIQYIQEYRTRYLEFINTKLKSSNHAIWTIACSTHVYAPYGNFYNSDSQRVPGKNGLTVKQAIEQFVIYDKINWMVDEKPWPNNQPCAY